MMMNNSLRNQCNLLPGSVIIGKWNKNEYKIIRELGYGANGIVYLAQNGNHLAALKISDNGTSVISEMNILKSFSKVRGSALGPSYIEADDWLRNGTQIPFYVMEYVKGDSFLDFIEKKGPSWTGVLILQLLSSLSLLHKAGWVFGDLKPENLIVTLPSYMIRCVDVGGATLIGRSIKEFTEFFDRGYWGLGSRKADPKYDLFAVAMIIINTAYPKRFSKKTGADNQLMEMVKQADVLKPYQPVIEKALLGRYASAEEMRNEMIQLLSKQSAPVSRNTATTRVAKGKKQKGKRKSGQGLMETFLLVVIVSFFYVLYIYGQLL